ncbi:MAG TPA: DNA repair exonuclease [Gemmatimonadaceae bacterium]|jgi:exonuclease SbcD|nr:DNA repair exonuclease [Gemmatimonadaceae bacterium]
MRLVHLSDLHLGFRQYQRLTPAGINQREADVATTFKNAIDKTIDLEPDLVLIAGDLFHTVRPSNPAILHAFLQFRRLKEALPRTDIILIAGNHDLPRASETGCILRLFAQLGVHVVDAEARRIDLPDVSVLAVPDTPVLPALVGNPAAKYNVLLLHGVIPGVLPDWFTAADRARTEVSIEDLTKTEWDYVALGHYHVYQRIDRERHIYYSGAIDYTGPSAWGELYQEGKTKVKGKGLIEHDLASGKHVFHTLPPSRKFIDLPPIPSYNLPPADIDRAIEATLHKVPLDGNIVRVVLQDVQRHVVRELNHAALREYQRRALHFQLDARRPDATRTAASGATGRKMSLTDIVREKLETRPIEADLERHAFVDLGLHYLKEAEAVEVPE